MVKILCEKTWFLAKLSQFLPFSQSFVRRKLTLFLSRGFVKNDTTVKYAPKKKDYCNVTTSLAYPPCDNKFRLPKEASKSTEVFNNMNCVSKKQCVTTSTGLDRWRSFKRSKGYVFDLLTLRRRHFCVSKICSKRVDIVPISLSTFWIFWSFFGGLIEWKLSLLCLDARLESYKRLSPFNSPVYIYSWSKLLCTPYCWYSKKRKEVSKHIGHRLFTKELLHYDPQLGKRKIKSWTNDYCAALQPLFMCQIIRQTMQKDHQIILNDYPHDKCAIKAYTHFLFVSLYLHKYRRAF